MFDSTSSLLACAHCSTIVVTRVETGEQTEFDPDFTVGKLAFSPDSRFLAASNLYNFAYVEIYDLQSNALLTTLRSFEQGVQDLQFSSDGTKLVALMYDGAIQVWDMDFAQEFASN